ncbi:hypothetical protein LMH87_009245 [Akanthomyces muscarius]|uniref:Prenyltransferase n=1 Tax=Akanthomyces muscarius TaxID=2231603 RepID=A0A9W8QDI6_AKAMU|nr:hypothetical protein LMH87_009245 [Akanthomyces muscarius]KAJ4152721.1 hypothetical protein LMH87_009245 [Akanthomyces muscarius]
MTKTLRTAVTATSTGYESRLAQQFGGHFANSWMDYLPAFWTPYIQLARLHRPHGLIVVTLSHLFGVFHAAFLLHSPLQKTLGVSATIIVGALFVNGGAHAWNDLIDAPIDAQVERTKTRPIPRGAISKRAALIFAAAQAFLAAVCLLALPSRTRVLGVNSLAVFVQGYAKLVLSVLAIGTSTLLYSVGVYSGMGTAFNGITVACYSLCVGVIVALLDLEDRTSCGKWCIFGFRFTGISIISGLLITYLISLY